MLFVLETLLGAEAFSLQVYGLRLCWIFIGGLFSGNQYESRQVFSPTKPAPHSSRPDLTRPSSAGTLWVSASLMTLRQQYDRGFCFFFISFLARHIDTHTLIHTSWSAQSHLVQVLQTIPHVGPLLWQAPSRTSHFDKLEPFSKDYISCRCRYQCTIITRRLPFLIRKRGFYWELDQLAFIFIHCGKWGL